MRFSLKSPCPKCPFRKDVTPYLTSGRVEELAQAIFVEGKTFTCHEHIHGETDVGDDGYIPSTHDQHCAGVMAMVDKLGIPHQMLQIAERLGLRKCDRLDPAAMELVYDSAEDMIATHRAEEE